MGVCEDAAAALEDSASAVTLPSDVTARELLQLNVQEEVQEILEGGLDNPLVWP